MAAKRNIIVALITRLVICVLLLALAAVVFRYLITTKVNPQPDERAGGAPEIEVMIARPVQVRRQYVGYGTARAMDSADVPARVSATVERIPEAIEPGAFVSAGELVVELDKADFERQVEVTTAVIEELDAQLSRLEIEEQALARRAELAEEEVTLAQDEYDRVRSAQERQAAMQREADQARQALIVATRNQVLVNEERDKLPGRRSGLEALKASQQATLRLAQQNLERCTITSPLSGVLQDVDVEVGENVPVGQRVARVVSLDRVEVGLQLPASARPDVGVGDQVELSSAGAMVHEWSALVTRIAPEDDPETRTTTVYVEVRQSRGDAVILAPGMFLEGLVTSSQRTTRWVVPRRSVQSNRLTIIEDGVVTSRAIVVDYHLERPLPQLGVPDMQWVVLRDPLDDGAQVVLNASRLLAEGSTARALPVRPAVAAGGGEPAAPDGPEASP